MTTIEVLQKASDLGLKLGSEVGALTYTPAGHCPAHLIEALKAHKWHLLVLLQQPFMMVYSKTLEQTVFFCQDADTKAMLVEAGADPGSIYTKAELEPLIKARRLFNASLKGLEAAPGDSPRNAYKPDQCV